MANSGFELRRWDAAVLLVVGGLAGITAGTFVHVLQTRFVHLVILYSLAMGAIVGLTLREAVYRMGIRAPIAAALIAGLCGATAWTTPLAIDYAQYRLSVGDRAQVETVSAWISGELEAGTAFQKHTDRVIVGWLGTLLLWIVELFFAVGLAFELAYTAKPRAGEHDRAGRATPPTH
jgi:hypothetical protein